MIKRVFVMLSVIGLLYSCSTSNDVVSNGFFQKRKYQKGWHVNKTQKIKKTNGVVSEDNFVAEKSVNREQETIERLANDNNKVAESKSSDLITSGTTFTILETIESNAVVEQNTTSLTSTFDATTLTPVSNVIIQEAAPTKIVKEEKVQAGGSLSTNKLLLIIIALFISWLSVGIYTDWNLTPTVINLLLWLLWGYGISLGGALIGLGFIAFIHALLIILDII